MVSRCLKRPQMSREGVPPARKPFKERFRAPRARKVENIVQNALICTILVVPTGDNVGNYCRLTRLGKNTTFAPPKKTAMVRNGEKWSQR